MLGFTSILFLVAHLLFLTTTIHPGSSQRIDRLCPSIGNFYDPDDCSSYFVCVRVRSVPFHITCGKGTVYSNQHQQCDWPRNVDCSRPTRKPYKFSTWRTGPTPTLTPEIVNTEVTTSPGISKTPTTATTTSTTETTSTTTTPTTTTPFTTTSTTTTTTTTTPTTTTTSPTTTSTAATTAPSTVAPEVVTFSISNPYGPLYIDQRGCDTIAGVLSAALRNQVSRFDYRCGRNCLNALPRFNIICRG